MCSKIFSVYVISSMILCIFFTYTKFYEMPFGYEQIFTVTEVIYYSFQIAIGLLFFSFTYKFFYLWRPRKIANHTYMLPKPRVRVFTFFFAQSLIIIYILFKLLSGAEYTNGEQYLQDYRPLGDKVSNLILIVQSVLVFTVWQKKSLFIVFSFCSILIAFLFAWVDSSRASILPLVGLLYYYYSQRKFISTSVVTIILVFFYMMAIVGRNYTGRIDYDSLIEILSSVFFQVDEVLVYIVSYFTAFSVFQFAYITRDMLGDFSAYDLIYSIIPLPSFVWPYVPDYESWRADEFRPMGAISEVYRVSPIIFFIYFSFKGFISHAIDSMSNDVARLFATAIFVMTVVMMFQYNLRSIQWFYYLIAILVYLDFKGFMKFSRHQSRV